MDILRCPWTSKLNWDRRRPACRCFVSQTCRRRSGSLWLCSARSWEGQDCMTPSVWLGWPPFLDLTCWSPLCGGTKAQRGEGTSLVTGGITSGDWGLPWTIPAWGERWTLQTGFFLLSWKKTWHCRAQRFIKHWNICYCFDTISSLGLILEKKKKLGKVNSVDQWWPVIVPFVNRQDDEWSSGSFLCPRPCRNKWDVLQSSNVCRIGPCVRKP